MLQKLIREYPLWVALATLGIVVPLEHTLSASLAGNLFGFVLLFAVIVYAALSVAHHAELLAHKYGEPYGTLILTMSAVLVEIVIIVIMMTQSHNPDLARDTIYSAIMLDINGLLGLAAIIGGIKHGEQQYNIDSTNSYMSMILVAVGIAMVLPHFIDISHHWLYFNFLIVMFLLLYSVFTRIQLKEHRYFFEYKRGHEPHYEVHATQINGPYHAAILSLSIVLIGFLSEVLALFMKHDLEALGLPLALGAFSVAVISAAPELITAIRSAAANNMQTVINIAFGASLATVLLTIPAVLVVTELMGLEIHLALTPIQGIMIGLTLIVGIVNFNDGETNMLEGFINFVLFMVFFFLMFV